MKIFLKKTLLVLLLIIYLLLLLKLILLKHLTITDIVNHIKLSNEGERFWGSHNFIPFKTIIYYLFIADINFTIRFENIVGNIVAFVPFGCMLPLLSSKFQSYKIVFLSTFSLSLSLELIQLISGFGSFDVDDLLLNTIGGLLGSFPIIYFYFRKQTA